MREGKFKQRNMPEENAEALKPGVIEAPKSELAEGKERTRVYENPADDPVIKEIEKNITEITNKDVTQTQKGMWGEATAKEASGMGYGGVWNRNFNRVNIQQWDNFLRLYPEKAAAYRDKFEPIKRAFEGQERLRQYREQQERQEREGVETIDSGQQVKSEDARTAETSLKEGREGIETPTGVEVAEGHPDRQEEGKEEIFDPKVESKHIEEAIAQNQVEIDRLTAILEDSKTKLKEARTAIGLPEESENPTHEQDIIQDRLATLLRKQEQLGEEREEMEVADGLNKVLEELNKLPKEQLIIIIQTGEDKNGREIVGPNGEAVNPDIAKELAKMAEQGIKKITKLALKTLIGIVEGVIGAIFETAKEISK